MTVPAAKVRALCTASEASLVRSSRKAELAKLDRAQVKKLANQARALRNKWREAGRRQPGGKKSSGKQPDAATNSQLKEEIFREAQGRFETRLAELEKADSAGGKTRPAMTKKRRSAEHRATRAAVRKGMTAVEDLLNVSERPAKSAKRPKSKSTEAPAAAAKPSSDKKSGQRPRSTKSKTRPPVKAKATALSAAEAQPQLSKGKQRQAVVAAKQARIAASGVTAHRGHISARGRRSQARRDAR